MHDVPYYRERFADPAFFFTPDAEFPVSYGEKGLYDATLTSKRFEDGAIVDIEGGAAPNAVPGIAHAFVRADAVDASRSRGRRRHRRGRGHRAASTHRGRQPMQACPTSVKAPSTCLSPIFWKMTCARRTSGRSSSWCASSQARPMESNLGIKTADEHFGELTVVGGTICMQDGRRKQTLDSRFPTSTRLRNLRAPLPRLRARRELTSRRRAWSSRSSSTPNRAMFRRFSPHTTRPRVSTPSPSRRAAARTRASSPAPRAWPRDAVVRDARMGGRHARPGRDGARGAAQEGVQNLRAHHRPSDGARSVGGMARRAALRSARRGAQTNHPTPVSPSTAGNFAK